MLPSSPALTTLTQDLRAAERLATFASSVDASSIPTQVREAAVLHLLDTLGCGLAARGLGVATQGATLAAADGGAGRASTIGLSARVPETAAALANGMLCHGIDFDDTHPDAIAHVSAVVCPAAIAAAEASGATGAALVTAQVVGNEIVARIGTPAAAAYMRKGFHPTSVCGVFGAAAAAARLGGLAPAATASALGIAGSMASGLFEYLAAGTETKPVHAGWAAHAGVTAARLAALGGEGPPSVLEGRFGLFASYFDDPEIDLSGQLDDLGERWETPRIAFKPYPACHFVHSCVDAAKALRERGVSAEDVVAVRVSIPDPGVPLVLEPADHKRRPRTPYDAKFSLQYCVAAMLVHGRVDVATYTDEAIVDSQVLELAARVEYVPHDFPSYPEAFPGKVEVELRDGRSPACSLDHQRGGDRNPMTPTEIREKFRANAGLALSLADVEELESAILTLDKAHDLSGLTPLRRAHTKEAA